MIHDAPRSDPRIGLSLADLDTPSLLLDRAACDRNLARMASAFAGGSHDTPMSVPRAQLRPHFKNHKCVTLAKRQLAAGACGITCAKLAEAEILARHGVTDLLVANQVVGASKLERLAKLSLIASLSVAIDHPAQAAAISAAAQRTATRIGLLIEVDIGMGRCGVQPGLPALELARHVKQLPNVELRGIQAFEGHLVNHLDRDERAARACAAMQLAIDTRRLLEQHGIPIRCLSGCSTATYDSTGRLPGVDEVQAGSYATMDCQYQRLVPEFELALTVLARVISRPSPDRAVLDMGVKAAGGEFGVPQIKDCPEVVIPYFLSEEHLVVCNPPGWELGELVQVIPSHSCTTCNLHREFVIHDEGRVVDIWPIEGSGALT